MVIFDPMDRLGPFPTEYRRDEGIMEATLSIKDNMEDRDIYTLARKLAELLLEQL